MKSGNQETQTYSYTELYSKYFFHKRNYDIGACPEYTLIFVFSGELTVRYSSNKTTLRKGEYIFLRQDSRTTLLRSSYNEEVFSGAFLGFHRSFLCEFHRLFSQSDAFPCEDLFGKSIVKITRNPYMDSMYVSLLPYFEWESQPSEEVLEIKLIEAVLSLLQTDLNLYYYLFGFPIHQEASKHSKLYNIQNDIKHLCLFNLSSSITSGKIETNYIKKEKAGKTSDIYFEVSYRDNGQSTTLTHRHYNAYTLN